LAIFFIIVLGILSLKPYDGISIKDINSNPKDYENKTVTTQAWFNGYSEKGSIYQEDYFSDKKHSMRVYIDENVDKSMLFPDREYLWTGIITVGEYVGGDLYAEIKVTKIDALYDDYGRHIVSRLVGSWKEIEYNNEPYTKNTTWTFNQNNTLKVIHINITGVVTNNSCEHFAVDDDLIYYEISSLPNSDRKYIYDKIGNYYLSENYTRLTIETDDGYLFKFFQKI